MSNEEAKQEAIKKAYGEHFNLLENFINSDGEVCKAMCPDNTQNIFGNIFWENLNGMWWPKTLSGIQNNNGWIRIEPDGSNLPENGLFKMCKEIKKGEWWYISHDDVEPDDVEEYFRDLGFTHYKPITPELKPIY